MSASTQIAADRPRRRLWWLAALLSLLAPGVGQLYAGRWRRAVVFLLATAFMDLSFILGIWSFAPVLTQPNGFWFAAAIVAGLVSFRIVAIVDAAIVAWRAPARPLAPYQRWYVYIVLLCLWIAPGFFNEGSPSNGTASYSIPGGSMQPTLQIGDNIIGVRLSETDGLPPRGTIVTHTDVTTGDTYVRRLIGLPGDVVEMRDGRLILNGTPVPTEPAGTYRNPSVGDLDMLRETLPDSGSYLVLDARPNGPYDNMPPLIVPSGYVFLLGDNRDNARDDRVHGPTPIALLEARILYVYWSRDLSRIGERLN